ncbi:polynucleotide 5'-hydroxyl-kinase NOL9 isoform X2 [Scaptodrosophila lebanonensis]|uniref:Polynucleotide 5'-hydroxyl-kinase NOL9 isoform X2 n=1 Tax=Drosophila lebanonensis TaxID=7225 RepID=A0A6J2T3R8_DROLE|nr:polynucleotide 5'-hydroxyl-kinase NOL9 isoform X2 [Scaptodrosophila lebanonensis]
MSSALNKKVLNEIAFSFKLAEGRKPEQTKSIRAPAHLQYKFSVQNEARSVGQKSLGNSQDFSKMLSKAKLEPNMLKKRAREPELTNPVQTKKVKQDKLNSIEPEPKTKTKQTPLQSVAVGRDPQPTKQTKTFPPIQAKKIKQGALKDTQPDRKTEKEKVYPNVPVAQVKPKSSKVSKTVHRNEPGALKRPSTSPPLPVQKIKQDEPHPKGKTKQKRQLNVPDGKDKKKSTKAKKNVNTKNNFVPTAKDFSGPRTDADFCCLEEVEDGSPYGEDSDPLFSDDSYSLDSDSIVSHDENVMELGDEQSDSSGIMSDEQFPEICVIDATGQCESVAQLELLSPVTNELGACDDWLHIPDQSSEYIVNHIPIVTETEGEDVQAEQSDASSDISMEDDASVEDLNINESPSSTLTKDLTSSEYIVNHIPIVAETETEDVQAEQSAASSEISMEDDASAEDLNIKETCEDFTYPASGPTIENAIVTISENPADLQLSGLFENSPKANLVLAAIKYDLEIYGSVVVTLLAGNIEVNGFKLRKLLPETIYSPKGFSKVVLSPIPRKKTGKGDINLDQLHDSFSKAQIGNILSNYDEKTDALVLLQRNSGAQKMMNIFSKHIAENLFPHLNILSSSRPIGASEYLLHCLIQIAAKDGGLQVPAQWKKLALKNNSRMMITGGKSVGKSTLLSLKYLFRRQYHAQ